MAALPSISEIALPLLAAPVSPLAPGMVVVRSQAMRRLLGLLRAAATAAVERPVLLVGPSGSGRNFLARSLHALSPRAHKPIVEVSSLATSLPENWSLAAESARGGTLLVSDLDRLDEYGQRDLQCLLGSLARMTNPPRLCATALPDLDYVQRSGRFGRSLYNRLAVLRIEIPALTDRADDLPDLCRLLLSEHAHAHTRDRPPPTLSAEALSLLGGYGWPGNVRELSNVLLRALLGSEGPTITAEQIRALLPTSTPIPEVRLPIGTSLAEAERALILATLRACDGNKQHTAAQLGITRRTLYHKLARYQPPAGTS